MADLSQEQMLEMARIAGLRIPEEDVGANPIKDSWHTCSGQPVRLRRVTRRFLGGGDKWSWSCFYDAWRCTRLRGSTGRAKGLSIRAPIPNMSRPLDSRSRVAFCLA